MLDNLSRGDFAEQKNTKFRVVESNDSLELELTEITDLKNNGDQESFSLVFVGDQEKPLPQQIHRLEHDTFGALSIFLVPVGTGDRGIQYEAVFNRLKKG